MAADPAGKLGYNSSVLSRSVPLAWPVEAALAVLAAVIAFGLTVILQLQHRPFLLPVIAVLVAAMRGGFWAGLICGIVTVLLANYPVILPAGPFSLPALSDAYGLVVFALVAAIISMLVARRRHAQLTLEATLASIADGVVVTDRHGRVRFVNSAGETLTDWPLERARGLPVSRMFTLLAEDSRQVIGNPMERALRSDGTAAPASHALLVGRRGLERPIAHHCAPIRDHNGRMIGAVLVFRDISAQRRVERLQQRQTDERDELLERERSARNEAERANRLKDEFLATLSHELRTPLNAVLGWSHMLTRRQLTPDQQRQALASIHRNAQAQARLVDDTVDLSKIVTGRMALAAERLDLSDIVRTTAESFRPAVLGKRQEMRLNLALGAMVTGDPQRLRQIAWNLLSNATKFTPEEGVITVEVEARDARVHLAVSDTGQGIDAAFLPFVFEPFRQGDSSPTRGHVGLGLGLALVRHLVEAHGGSVSAWSEGPGQGATVHVSLPAHVEAPQGSITDSGEFKVGSTAGTHRHA